MSDANQTQTQTQSDPWAVVGQSPAPPSATQNTPQTSQSDPWAVVSQAPDPSAQKPDTGVWAGVKRNTVDAMTGLYHAFTDPATEQEKQELLSKVREANANGDKFSESMATNPTRATLALHRIVDAPADVLAKKGRDEVGVAKDLINNREYWRGGNMYLSGLTDRLLSGIPVAGPAINSIAERAENGDVTGAATDVGSLVALEHAPAIVKAGGDITGKVASATGDAIKNTADAIKPEWLKKRPETPAPQHGTPVRVESPLDSATISKTAGGKDLSQEALNTLKGHVGETIPAGGTAKTKLMEAVQPVAKTISDTVEKMNGVVKDSPKFTTSVAQDGVFGEGTLPADIDQMKASLPPSVRGPLSEDVDAAMHDADKALNSQDASEVLEHRRLLGNKIDWENIVKNPTTPAEAQNLARVKVYKALGDKIHSEIPDTVELDKTLQPNLELRSHLQNRLGERVIADPHAATVEAQSEFKKGQASIENATHNAAVDKRWSVIGSTLKALGYGTLGGEVLKHLVP